MKAGQRIFDFLASFEFLFILLALITIAMAIGTVLPQQDEPENYIRFWGKIEKPSQETQQPGMMPSNASAEPEIDRAKGEGIYNRYRSLGFLNLYHSGWFLVLSYLLCFNVFLCVVKRITKMKLFAMGVRRRILPAWEKTKFPISLSWAEEKDITLVEAYLLQQKRIRRNGFRLIKGETSLDTTNPSTNGKRIPTTESVTIIASKGFSQKPLSIIFHLSIIIALIFCGLGSLYAFETTIMLEKGVVEKDWLNRGKLASKTFKGNLVGLPPSLSMSKPEPLPLAPELRDIVTPEVAFENIKSGDKDFLNKLFKAHYSMTPNPFTIDHFDRLILYPAFYGIELTDFETEYVEYKFKPSAKDWFPTVRFVDDSGKTLHQWTAESNHPAKFKGLQYHISDYLYKFQLIIESPDHTMTWNFPSYAPDNQGFNGYFARKAYEMDPVKIRMKDKLMADLFVKSVYTGKLFKSERSKDFTQIDPYLEVEIKKFKIPESQGMNITPQEPEGEKKDEGKSVDDADKSPGTDSSMNDGGMPSKSPQYVKLRTRQGYIDAGEEPVSVRGCNLYLGDINPIVEFGVRHDPGIVWFYFFGYLACVAMALKIYYPAYRLKITIKSMDKERATLRYDLTGWGLFSNIIALRKNISLPKDIN